MDIDADNFEEAIERIRNNDPEVTSLEFKGSRTKEKDSDSCFYTSKQQYLAIFEALKNNLLIKKIDFKEISYEGDWFADSLKELLSVNNTITEIDITSIYFSKKGFQSLNKGLSENKGLRKLKLLNNKLDKIDAIELSKMLTKNSSLLNLEVSMNNFGDSGIKAIAEGLAKNKNILRANFSKIEISEIGVNYLFDMLLVNKSINSVDFDGVHDFMERSKYSKKTMDKIFKIISKNKNLAEMKLDSHSLTIDETSVNKAIKAFNQSNLNMFSAPYMFGGTTSCTDNSIKLLDNLKNDNLSYLDIGNSYDSLIGVNRHEMVAALDAFPNNNKNVLHADNQMYKARKTTKATEIVYPLIEKIEKERYKFTKKDVQDIQEYLPAIITLLRLRSNRIGRELEHISPVIEQAIKKADKIGLELKVPQYYRAYPIIKVKPKKMANIRKINFETLYDKIIATEKAKSATEMFAKVSVRRKYPIAYHAALADQMDELLDFLANKNGILSKEDLLYSPTPQDPRLIDLIVKNQSISEIMTLNNWSEDPNGLSDIIKEVPKIQLEIQMKNAGLSLSNLKSSIAANKIKKGRKPIKISF